MNWILLATPVLGVVAVVSAVLSLRLFLPLHRTNAPRTSDEAIERTAIVFGEVVGATIRDERRRAVETIFEDRAAKELEHVITENRARRS